MNDGAGLIAIEMPYRAEDAAIVPVTLRATLPPGDTRRVLAITLVIDQNPAPMAARFELGPDSSVSEISTRVRVNNYTDVHAVAELSDGQLYMTKTYVRRPGMLGQRPRTPRSARQAEDASGNLPRQPAKVGQPGRAAQIMIGHRTIPACRWTVTQLYIPAFFVNELRVWQDDTGAGDGRRNFDFRDPNIRFTYVPNGAKRFRSGQDTEVHCSRTNGRSRLRHLNAAGVARRNTSLQLPLGRVRSLGALLACSDERNWPPGSRAETCSARFRP